jgi:tRNA(Arg) A34 adenosine deaminase TadA
VLEHVCLGNERTFMANVAAAIVYRRNIIAIGINTAKSDPFQKRFAHHEEAIYLHAELQAIKRALAIVDTADQLADCSLYVCRLKASGPRNHVATWGLAKPCRACEAGIRAYGIKRVYYTTDTEGEYAEL